VKVTLSAFNVWDAVGIIASSPARTTGSMISGSQLSCMLARYGVAALAAHVAASRRGKPVGAMSVFFSGNGTEHHCTSVEAKLCPATSELPFRARTWAIAVLASWAAAWVVRWPATASTLLTK
jgi:hypothetical protein